MVDIIYGVGQTYINVCVNNSHAWNHYGRLYITVSVLLLFLLLLPRFILILPLISSPSHQVNIRV